MLTPFLITLKVVEALEECGIHYLIGGSLGSSLYGIPRATLDADLVSDLEPGQIDRLVEKLKDEFFIDPEMIRDALQHQSCFNIIHLATMFKVDIFILKSDPYAKEEFSRRRLEIVPETGRTMQLAAPEDIILTKLLWYRDGGGVSERQWLDAKGVLMIQGERLDRDYLFRWANRLGVGVLLEKLFQEIS